MKKIINPYLISLLKDNILYIVLNSVMFLLILFFISSNSQKTIENNAKIETISKDIEDLQRRSNIFSKAFLSKEDLDSTIKLLDALIPNNEDYFSIIYALDTLSHKTNFLISSYVINIQSSSPEKLKLSINGTGDRNAFLNFLKNYNYGGGRLITSDKVELNSQISGQIKVDIAFYNKQSSLSKRKLASPLSESLLQELASLKNKINISFKEASNEGAVNLDYSRKSNPFE